MKLNFSGLTVYSQRDLSVGYEKIGDIYLQSGDIPKAKESYEKSLKTRENLIQQDPSNSGWQRDLVVSYYKLYTLKSKIVYLRKAIKVLEDMKNRSMLLPSNEKYLEIFKEIVAKETNR